MRRMLDQNVLKTSVRATRPGHGRVVEELRLADRQQGRASQREHAADRRKPHVPGVITFALGKPVRAKTAGQVAYINAIESHTITFAIGPAGTGNAPYLAVAKSGARLSGSAGAAHHPDQTCGGSRREPRFPAGHTERKSRSVSSSVVRRAFRHAWSGPAQTLHG